MLPPAASMTMPALLRSRVATDAGRRFFVCDDSSLTFAQAERRSSLVARALIAAGAHAGTRVGLLYPNDVDFVVTFLAATRIGAVAVPFSTLQAVDELRWQIVDSGVEILLAAGAWRGRDFRGNLKAALPALDYSTAPPLRVPCAPSLRRIFLAGMPDECAPWSTASLPALAADVTEDFLSAAEAAVRPADPLLIVYTSGSTGMPKGVIHAHGALLEHLHNLNRIRAFMPDEVLFSNAPFFWIGGLAYALLGALEAGGRLVTSISTSAAVTLDTIERERPTMVNGFPQSVAHLPRDPSYARRDFSSVRRGNLYAIMPPALRPEDPTLRHNLLGSTETGSVYLIHGDEGPIPERLRGSFGKPAPGFEVRISDPETGQACAHRTDGEIWVRGPYLMQGYVGRAWHEVFTPDGWYRTGDLACRDEEGFVFFKGRLGDMIKTSGANVSPREVEQVLAEITGRRVHVLGLEDAGRGQIVAAAIAVDGDTPDEAALRERLKQRLSAYKIPRRFLFLPQAEIPMTATGKLDQRRLAALFRARG